MSLKLDEYFDVLKSDNYLLTRKNLSLQDLLLKLSHEKVLLCWKSIKRLIHILFDLLLVEALKENVLKILKYLASKDEAIIRFILSDLAYKIIITVETENTPVVYRVYGEIVRQVDYQLNNLDSHGRLASRLLYTVEKCDSESKLFAAALYCLSSCCVSSLGLHCIPARLHTFVRAFLYKIPDFEDERLTGVLEILNFCITRNNISFQFTEAEFVIVSKVLKKALADYDQYRNSLALSVVYTQCLLEPTSVDFIIKNDLCEYIFEALSSLAESNLRRGLSIIKLLSRYDTFYEHDRAIIGCLLLFRAGMNFLSHGEYGEELSLVIELIGITLRNLSSSFSLMRLFDVVSFSLLKAFLLSTTKVIENKHEALEALYYLTLSNTKNFEQVHDENATVPHNADVGGLMESFRLLFSQALELSDAELQLVFMKALLSYMTAELNSLLKGSNHSEIVDSFRKLLIDAFDTIFLPLEHLLANADLLSLYIENINLLTLNFTEIHWLEDLIFLGYLGVFLYSSSNVGLHFDLLKDHLCLLSRVVCYSSPWKTLPATETRAQWIVDSIAQGLPFLPKGVNYIEVYRNMSPGARYEKALLSLMHCFMQGTGIGFKSSELIQMVADSTICYMKKCLFQEDIHYLSALDLFSKCAMDGILISSLPDFERLNHVTLSVLDYSKHLVSWVFSYDHICIQTRLCLALYLMANFQYCSDTTVSQSRVCGKNNTGQFLEQPVETLTVLLCFHETFHRHCFLELLIELILSRNTMFSLPAINFFRKIMECFLQVSSPKKLFFEIFEKHSFESILCSCCFSYLRQYPLIAAFYERLEVLNEMSEHDLLSVIKALICCFQFFEVTYVPTSAISKLCYIVERKSLDSEVTEYIILFFHFLIECSANDVQKKVYIQLIGNKRIINIFFKTLLYKDKFGAKSSWLVLLLLTDFLHLSRKFNISKTSEATSHFSEIPVRSLLPKLLSIRVPIVEATMNFLSEVLSLRETETESSEDFPFRINFPFGPFFMRWRFREVREVLWIALNKFHDCEDLLGASIFCIIKICESVKKELLAQNAWLWYAVRSFIEGVTERSHQLSTEIVFGLNKLLSIFTIDESAEDLVTMWKAYLASLMTDAEEEKIQPLSQTEYDLLLKDVCICIYRKN